VRLSNEVEQSVEKVTNRYLMKQCESAPSGSGTLELWEADCLGCGAVGCDRA